MGLFPLRFSNLSFLQTFQFEQAMYEPGPNLDCLSKVGAPQSGHFGREALIAALDAAISAWT